jgi:hypothetical protein
MPVFESAGSYGQSAGAAPALTVDAGVPAGVTADDIILLVMFTDPTSTPTTITAPAGFTEPPSSPQVITGGSLNLRMSVYWKRATGAESGSYTTTFSSNTFSEAVALRFSGCVTSGSPFDTTAGNIDPVGSGTTVAVSVTTTVPETTLVHAVGLWSGGTWTPPAGYTARGTPGGFNLMLVSTKDQIPVGSSGTVQATCSATSNNVNAAWLAALKGVPVPAWTYGYAVTIGG